MTATMTKTRTTPTRSVFGELDDLDAAIVAAAEGPGAIERERSSAAMELTQARRRLQGLYATPEDQRDATNFAQVRGDVDARETEYVGRRWDDEIAGAHEGVARAQAAREAFLDEHMPELARKGIADATAVRDAKHAALDALIATGDEEGRLVQMWPTILGPYALWEAGGEHQYSRLREYSVNVSMGVQVERMALDERYQKLIADARQLRRELELRPLPRCIPPAIDSEVGGVAPGGAS